MSLRHQIRAITDFHDWLPLSAIYAALPKPRPTRVNMEQTAAAMAGAGQLRRKTAPKHSGKGVKYVYKSGRRPVVDGRTRRKGKTERRFVGHMELGRRARAKLADRRT